MGTYDVGLIGESNYQSAVSRLRIGERVELNHDEGNRHDKLAVVATSSRGEVIGYIARDSFVQRLVAVERRAVFATVAKVTGGTRGKASRGVVLEVKTAGDATQASEQYAQLVAQKGCLSFLS